LDRIAVAGGAAITFPSFSSGALPLESSAPAIPLKTEN